MNIDWFTTGAQIVNFLILVWLLKKLLFKPIISIMEHREQNLNNRFQQTELQMRDAQTLKKKYEIALQQLQTEKNQAISDARLQAKEEKTQLLNSLNKEIEQKKYQFHAEMLKQQQDLADVISRTISEKSIALSQNTLSLLADQSLDQKIISKFLQQLSALSKQQQTEIRRALLKDNPAKIITPFELDSKTKQQIQNCFDQFTPDSRFLFEQSNHLISGIALEADGRCWEWNVARYLTELETDLIK